VQKEVIENGLSLLNRKRKSTIREIQRIERVSFIYSKGKRAERKRNKSKIIDDGTLSDKKL
jgi:hypothetical protein